MTNERTISEREKHFGEMLAEFQNVLGLSLKISVLVNGTPAQHQRFALGSWLFARLCVMGMSIDRLATGTLSEEVFLLDHTSLAALSRNLLEAGLMFFYLAQDGVDDEEWQLRLNVLKLHDCMNRYRFFKPLRAFEPVKAEEQLVIFRSAAADIKKLIVDNPVYQQLDVEKKERILQGQVIYIRGMRSVVKAAGWDKNRFDADYAYLSAHTHSAPMSYFRNEEHHISFDHPSEHQFGLSSYALQSAQQTMQSAAKRMLEINPGIVKGGAAWLEEIRAEAISDDGYKFS